MEKDELKMIRRQLSEIKSLLQGGEIIKDTVNKNEALKILAVSSKTLSNYIHRGLVNIISVNVPGQPFFSRKELQGHNLIYKGSTIKKSGEYFYVGSELFFNISDARDAIDKK